jgi:hypothetical protein
MLVDKRSFTECDCVENDSFMSYVVLMERIPQGL